MKLMMKLLSVFLVATVLVTIADGYLAVRAETEKFEQQTKLESERLAVAVEPTLADIWKQSGAEGHRHGPPLGRRPVSGRGSLGVVRRISRQPTIPQTPRKKDFAMYRFIRRSRSGHAIRAANGSFTPTGRWRWTIDAAVSNLHGR